MKELASADLQGIYGEMAEVIGVEATISIYEQFKGQQITFPARLYKKSYVRKEVNSRYDGTNLKILAKEFNYTERWIRDMIYKEKDMEGNEL